MVYIPKGNGGGCGIVLEVTHVHNGLAEALYPQARVPALGVKC
jgi:hypothetical protein